MVVPGSKPFDLEFDRAFIAIGQMGSFNEVDSQRHGQATPFGLNLTPAGFVEVDESFRTSITGAYAAGDAVTGPSSVVEAMATGRAVARSVHRGLSGEDVVSVRG